MTTDEIIKKAEEEFETSLDGLLDSVDPLSVKVIKKFHAMFCATWY